MSASRAMRWPGRRVRICAGRSSGASVAWTSAWMLATSTFAWPARHAARAATRAAVSSGTSSLRSKASEVRGSRTATRFGSPSHAPSSSATRSPISASRAIQQIRSGSGARASAAARYDFAPCGTDVSPTCLPCIPGAVRASPSRSRRLPNAPVSCSRRGRTARSGTRRPAPRDDDPARSAERAAAGRFGRAGWVATPPPSSARRAAGSRSSTSASTDAVSRSSSFSASSDAARRSAHSRETFSAMFRWRVVRPRYRSLIDPWPLGALRALRSRVVVRLARQDPPPAGLRAADPVVVGRTAHLARLRAVDAAVRVGRCLELEAVEPVRRLRGPVPRPCLDGIRRGVEQDRQPRLLVDRERRQHVVDRAPRGVPDPDP